MLFKNNLKATNEVCIPTKNKKNFKTIYVLEYYKFYIHKCINQ